MAVLGKNIHILCVRQAGKLVNNVWSRHIKVENAMLRRVNNKLVEADQI